MVIKDKFTELHKRNLMKDLESELSGNIGYVLFSIMCIILLYMFCTYRIWIVFDTVSTRFHRENGVGILDGSRSI